MIDCDILDKERYFKSRSADRFSRRLFICYKEQREKKFSNRQRYGKQ
jgi:hypothetical protein